MYCRRAQVLNIINAAETDNQTPEIETPAQNNTLERKEMSNEICSCDLQRSYDTVLITMVMIIYMSVEEKDEGESKLLGYGYVVDTSLKRSRKSVPSMRLTNNANSAQCPCWSASRRCGPDGLSLTFVLDPRPKRNELAYCSAALIVLRKLRFTLLPLPSTSRPSGLCRAKADWTESWSSRVVGDAGSD